MVFVKNWLNTIVIPLSIVFTRINAAAPINSLPPQCNAYSSPYCYWQLKNLLHHYIKDFFKFRTKCYYIKDVITFRIVYYI